MLISINMAARVLVWISLFLTLLAVSQGYFATIDAHEEVCYFDRVSSGTKLGLTFEVVEGGFLDIDVQVGILHFRRFCGFVIIPYTVRSQARMIGSYTRGRGSLVGSTQWPHTWTACTSTALVTRCRV